MRYNGPQWYLINPGCSDIHPPTPLYVRMSTVLYPSVRLRTQRSRNCPSTEWSWMTNLKPEKEPTVTLEPQPDPTQWRNWHCLSISTPLHQFPWLLDPQPAPCPWTHWCHPSCRIHIVDWVFQVWSPIGWVPESWSQSIRFCSCTTVQTVSFSVSSSSWSSDDSHGSRVTEEEIVRWRVRQLSVRLLSAQQLSVWHSCQFDSSRVVQQMPVRASTTLKSLSISPVDIFANASHFLTSLEWLGVLYNTAPHRQSAATIDLDILLTDSCVRIWTGSLGIAPPPSGTCQQEHLLLAGYAILCLLTSLRGDCSSTYWVLARHLIQNVHDDSDDQMEI